jgi:hypothetical protein
MYSISVGHNMAQSKPGLASPALNPKAKIGVPTRGAAIGGAFHAALVRIHFCYAGFFLFVIVNRFEANWLNAAEPTLAVKPFDVEQLGSHRTMRATTANRFEIDNIGHGEPVSQAKASRRPGTGS